MALVVLQRFYESVASVRSHLRATVVARRLEKWSRIEVRAVIRFLWAKNVAASEIHRQIVEVCGDKAMSRQQVAKWCRSYQAGREQVENRNMEAPPIQPQFGSK